MKRVITALLVLVMVLSLCAVAGCKSTGDSKGTDSKGGATTIPGGTTDVSAEVLEALANSGEVGVWVFTEDPESSKPINNGWFGNPEFNTYFEEVYGGKINKSIKTWEGWESEFVTAFAANDAPDLIYSMAKLWPKIANRGMVYSNNELSKLVVGLDHPTLSEGFETVEKNFTYKNEVYGFALQDTMCFWSIVNTDIYKQYGVKSPVDYYNEGMWTMDTFKKSCKELVAAAGSGADGQQAAYGYYCWDQTAFTRGNGQQIVDIDPKTGKLTLNFQKVELQNTLEDIRSAFKDEGYATTDSMKFGQGKMGIEFITDENIVRDTTGDDGKTGFRFNWKLIPFPKGADNKTNMLPGSVRSWCVTTSTENPQGAVNLIIALNTAKQNKMFKTDKSDISNVLDEETLQMVRDNDAFGVNENIYGIGSLWGQQWNFWSAIRGGKQTVTEVLKTYSAQFQAQVEQEELAAS